MTYLATSNIPIKFPIQYPYTNISIALPLFKSLCSYVPYSFLDLISKEDAIYLQELNCVDQHSNKDINPYSFNQAGREYLMLFRLNSKILPYQNLNTQLLPAICQDSDNLYESGLNIEEYYLYRLCTNILKGVVSSTRYHYAELRQDILNKVCNFVPLWDSGEIYYGRSNDIFTNELYLDYVCTDIKHWIEDRPWDESSTILTGSIQNSVHLPLMYSS